MGTAGDLVEKAIQHDDGRSIFGLNLVPDLAVR